MSSSSSTNLRSYLDDLNKIENSIIALYWSVYSINMSFNDMFIDRYDTEEGIDKARSYYTYNAVEKYIIKPSLTNLVLTTISWTSSKIGPTSAYCVLEIDSKEDIQPRVDITIQISTDGGTHYSVISSPSIYKTFGDIKYIRGDISGIPNYSSCLLYTSPSPRD